VKPSPLSVARADYVIPQIRPETVA
jgi:hypothetical protein